MLLEAEPLSTHELEAFSIMEEMRNCNDIDEFRKSSQSYQKIVEVEENEKE